MNIKFKNAAKALKKELQENHNIELAHSSVLNLLSRTLGSKNYNTLNGIFGDDIFINLTNQKQSENIKDDRDYYFNLTEVNYTKKPSEFLMGRDMLNNQDIYIDNINQNIGIFGTMGSGLYVTILNILKQVLMKKSGTLFIDGSGDEKLLEEFAQMVKENGRGEDLYILNFNKNKHHHSFNPFEKTELIELKNIFASYISGGRNSNDFFVNQAINVLEMAFGILEFLKTRGEIITIDTLSKVLDLNVFIANIIPENEDGNVDIGLLKSNKVEEFKEFIIPKDFIFEGSVVSQDIEDYLKTYGVSISLDIEGDFCIPEQMTVQHGYSMNYFKPIIKIAKKMKSLSLSKSDIDFGEIISGKKIAYCLIPSLSLTSEEKSLLGTIILSSIRNVYEKVLHGKFNTDADGEFILMFNNISNYIDGNKEILKDILIKSRSIGAGCVITSQNTNALSGSKEDGHFVDTLMSNMGTKIFLKNNDYAILNKIKLLLSIQSEAYIKNQLGVNEINEVTQFLNETSNGKGIIFSQKGVFKIQTPWYE